MITRGHASVWFAITDDANRPTRIDDYDNSLTYPCYGGYHFIDYVQQNNEHAYYHNDNMTHKG